MMSASKLEDTLDKKQSGKNLNLILEKKLEEYESDDENLRIEELDHSLVDSIENY